MNDPHVFHAGCDLEFVVVWQICRYRCTTYQLYFIAFNTTPLFTQWKGARTAMLAEVVTCLKGNVGLLPNQELPKFTDLMMLPLYRGCVPRTTFRLHI